MLCIHISGIHCTILCNRFKIFILYSSLIMFKCNLSKLFKNCPTGYRWQKMPLLSISKHWLHFVHYTLTNIFQRSALTITNFTLEKTLIVVNYKTPTPMIFLEKLISFIIINCQLLSFSFLDYLLAKNFVYKKLFLGNLYFT